MAKPPSWNEIHRAAMEFSERWAGETDENSSAQPFWIEFLGIFGIDRKRVATFEARAKRTSTGGAGRIDLFWPGTLVVEHKSAGKSLAEAEQQAIDYLDSIEQKDFPGVVITSNFSHMRIRDLAGDNEPFEFPLTDLIKEIDRFGFLAGYKVRNFSSEQEAAVNVEAARLMGRLYEELSRNGYEGHDASILMTRLLFILFADDSGMWEKGLFEELVSTRSSVDGSDLGALIATLFQVLNKDIDKRQATTDELLLRFPFVNGGLFHDRIDIPSFDKAMKDELVRCTQFDWAGVSPAIFGSLFQAIKSKEARRALGEHYTTEMNIRRLLDPLILDELRKEFEKNFNNATKLEKLRHSLGTLRFLDPACGCGNFLVIAYRELRRLELDIMVRVRDITGVDLLPLDPTHSLTVRLGAFSGIEIEEWPAKIAETAMFLVDHQANLELAAKFGRTEDRLPITESANIVNANALEIDWKSVVEPSDNLIVLGNPPFIGSRLETDEQKLDQQRVWAGNKRAGTMDFVTNWFKLASEFVAGSQARVAFVSTNSITQGEQPSVLWEELWRHSMRIDFAHRTFSWSSEAPDAAAVHCVIIGFSARPKPSRIPLWYYPDAKGIGLVSEVSNISPYLTSGADIVIQSRQEPLVSGTPPMFFGSMPRDGGFLSKISGEAAELVRKTDPVAAKYLYPIIGAEELINGGDRWCLWLINATPSDIASSPALKERLAAVRKMRKESKAASTRGFATTPGLFAQIAQPYTPYLAVPSVSSETRDYLPTRFYNPEIIATNLLFTIPGADPVLFGVISSKVFTTWNKSVSGRLESRVRVSQEITYNNFPWLGVDDENRGAISIAAEKVLEARRSHPDATLGELYSPVGMPANLVAAHRVLDNVVMKAYKIPKESNEGEIMASLLKKYSELQREETLFNLEIPTPKPRKKK